MAKLKLEGELQIDSSKALEQTEKQGKKAFQSIEKEAKETKDQIEKTGEAGKKAGSKIKDSFKAGAVALGKIGIGVAAGAVAFKALQAIAAQVNTQFDTMASAKLFGVTLQDADRLQGVLSDVKTRFEALSLAVEGSQLGLSQDEMKRFAHLVNVLAAVTGQSKANLEARLKTGQITDRELGALSKITGQIKTQAGLQNQILAAQARQGGASLDTGQRIQALLAFTQASAKMEAQLGSLGKANPFDEIAKSVRSTAENIVKDLTPALRKIADGFKLIGPAVSAALNKMINFVDLAGKGWAMLYLRITKGKKAVEAVKLLNRQLAEQAALRKQILKQQDAARRKTVATLTPEQKRRQAIIEQLRKEAQQEELSRAAQARALLRNFERSALAAISRTGARGVGALVAGMSQTLELVKQFQAQLGPAFLTATSQTARKAQALVKLSLEAGSAGVEKLITGEKQRTNQLRAQLSLSKSFSLEQAAQNQLLNQRKSIEQARKAIAQALNILRVSDQSLADKMEATLNRTVKKLNEEAAVQNQLSLIQVRRAKLQERGVNQLKNERLRAGAALRLLKIRREISDIESKTNQDVKAAQAATEQISVIALEVRDLQNAEKNLAQALKDKLFLNSADIALKKDELATLRVIIKARQDEIKLIHLRSGAIIRAQRRSRQEETARKLLEIQQQANKEREKTLSMRIAAGAGAFGISPEDQTIARFAQEIQTRRQEIQKLNLERSQLESKLLRDQFTSTEARRAAQAQKLLLKTQIDQRKQQIDLIHKQREAELEALTTIGALSRSIYNESLQFSTRFAGALKSAIEGAVSGIGNLFAGVFEGLVSGADDLGTTIARGFLDLLAGISAQLGSFLLLAGTGLTAALVPSGAGAVAAGLGLLALSGILKGASSLMSAPATPAGAAPTPSVSTPDRGLPGPDRIDRAPRETFIAVISPDWNGTQEQQARRFFDWMQRNGRLTRSAFGGRS